MNEIFISYRRQDSPSVAARIYNEMTSKFGEKKVFKDVDKINPGENFVLALNQSLNSCKVALVVIGLHWLDAKDDQGKRRLDDPDDFVRIEIETLLRRNVPIIPILVDGAGVPKEEKLPKSIVPMLNAQARSIQPSEPGFQHDIDRIIVSVDQVVKRQRFNYPLLMGAYIIGFLAMVGGAITLTTQGNSPNFVPWGLIVSIPIFYGCWIFALVKAIRLGSTEWMVTLLAALATGPVLVLVLPVFAYRGPTRR